MAINVMDDYLTESQCAMELKRTLRTLRKWRAQGIGPAYTRVGRKVHYRADAVVDWLRDCEVTPVRERR